MDTKDIAKACVALARVLGLEREQEQDFAFEVMRLALFSDTPVAMERPAVEMREATEQATPFVQTPPKRQKKQPPVRVEKRETQERLLCREDTRCTCSKCNKVVYRVINDIYDGLQAEDFAAKFLPINHGKLLPVPLKLRAIDGCVMTDCPLCDGDMTLVLWGKRPENDFADTGVGSIGDV